MLSSDDMKLIVPEFKKFMQEKKPISFWLQDGQYFRYPIGIIIAVGETFFKIKGIKGDDKDKEQTYAYSCLKRYRKYEGGSGMCQVDESDLMVKTPPPVDRVKQDTEIMKKEIEFLISKGLTLDGIATTSKMMISGIAIGDKIRKMAKLMMGAEK